MTITTEIIVTAVAIVALLVLSAFFSGSETALTAASRARLHRLARKGDRRARTVYWLIERRERMIGAILLGNNLVNILASALATGLLIGWFGDAGVAYATVAMTVIVVIFAEIMPKTYAIRHADRTALRFGPALRVAVTLLSPAARTVQWVARLFFRMVGADGAAQTRIVTSAEEIRGTIELHSDEGGIIKHERDMLDSVLDLGDVRVSEIMVHRKNMFMLDVELPRAEMIERVLASPFTRVPLWRDAPENIVGVVHAKDILRAVAAGGGDVEAVDIPAIASEPRFVPETTTLREQLEAFRRQRAHFALVVDEYGSHVGLVTLEDILEEIVGEITDEHDVAAIGVRQLSGGNYVIDGAATIRDLNRRFDWELPDEEAATIAGLVIHEAQVIPEPGQVFTFHGFQFVVVRRNRNQITQLRVTPPPPVQRQQAV